MKPICYWMKGNPDRPDQTSNSGEPNSVWTGAAITGPSWRMLPASQPTLAASATTVIAAPILSPWTCNFRGRVRGLTPPDSPTSLGHECPSFMSHASLLTALLVSLFTVSLPVASSADDDAAKGTTEQKADPPKEPSLLDKLSKELLTEVDENPGKPKPEEKEDKFDRVATGMRSASKKLEGKETGDETTQLQEQVIRDLDDLIKQLQNPPPGGGGGGGSSGGGSSKSGKSGGGGQQQRAGGRGASGRGANGQPQEGTPQQQAQGGGSEQGGKDRKDAEGSDERPDSERKAAAEAARKKKLEIDVWGHLPSHLRDQLLNTYGERMLPKYEHLVKQFYEALSEQNEAKPRR